MVKPRPALQKPRVSIDIMANITFIGMYESVQAA